jgi:molybdopterin synthase catalytic subunit
MPAIVHLSEVTRAPIDANAVKALVSDSTTGAVVLFSGDVRDHDHGRTVISLTYEAHPFAAEVLTRVVNDFAVESDMLDVSAIAAVHRVGEIPIGDAALVVAVGSSHRGDAFAAASALVDLIKDELPVWKHQFFSDGTDEWVNCA